ncbi:MAG: hypothetical protein OCC49_09600 [Fibrobacterales bacterium]
MYPRLLLIFLCFHSILTGQSLITTVTINEVSGTSTLNYPVTMGLPLVQGDARDAVTAYINGSPVPTQTDIKVTYTDGTIRHCIISFIVPELQANSSVSVQLFSGGSNANTYSLKKGDLLESDFEALVTFDFYPDSIMSQSSLTASTSSRAILEKSSDHTAWLAGEIVTEFLIQDASLNPHNSINIQYQVRKYPGWNGTRVSVVAENAWHDTRGNVYYDVDLQLGHSNPTQVFAKEKVKHYHDSRWRRVFWIGDEPPRSSVQYDLEYLISTGYIPPYDTALGVAEQSIDKIYTSWDNETHWQKGTKEIMSWGLISPVMGMAGGRADLGVLPGWAVTYLQSMDWRAEEVVLRLGEQAGSFPAHIRNRATGLIATIDDFPKKNPYNWAGGDYLYGFEQGDMNSPMTLDNSHKPSLSLIPYLITGDYFYMEEQMFWGNSSLLLYHYVYTREKEKGIVKGSERAAAWGLRSMVESAVIAPDNSMEQAYFNEKIKNTIDHNVAHLDTAYKNNPFGYFTLNGQHREPDFPNSPLPYDTIQHGCSPWMNNYYIATLDQMVRLGFNEMAVVRDHMLKFPIGTLSNHPQFNKYDASAYRILQSMKCDECSTEDYILPTDWSELYRWNFDGRIESHPSEWPAPKGGHDYLTILHYVMAIAARVNIDGAQKAYDELHSHMVSKGTEIFRTTESPQWYLSSPVPKAVSTGNTDSIPPIITDIYTSPLTQSLFSIQTSVQRTTIRVSINTHFQEKITAPIKYSLYTLNGVRVKEQIHSPLSENAGLWVINTYNKGLYLVKVAFGTSSRYALVPVL